MAVSGEISVNATLTGNLTISEKVKIEANKNVSPSNVEQVVVPSENYDALAQVTVEAVSLQNKTVTPSASQQTVTADSGYDGLGTVTVEVASGGTDTLDELFNDGSQAQTLNMSDDNVAHACYGIKGGLNVVLPASVTTIEKFAFMSVPFLKNITAPGVTEIKQNAFDYASKSIAADLTFPACQTIRQYSFADWNEGAENKVLRFPVLSLIDKEVFISSNTISDIYIGYDGVCTLNNKNAFAAYGTNPINVHVPSSHLADYQANATWAGAVSSNYIVLVGDYA